MPSFLTQCPHCLTPFRVTDAQLAAADGVVRCGACLGVFSAAANRITVKPSAEEAAALAGSVEADERAPDTDAWEVESLAGPGTDDTGDVQHDEDVAGVLIAEPGTEAVAALDDADQEDDVEEDYVEEDYVEEDYVEEDYVEEDYVEEDYVEEDYVEEDHDGGDYDEDEPDEAERDAVADVVQARQPAAYGAASDADLLDNQDFDIPLGDLKLDIDDESGLEETIDDEAESDDEDEADYEDDGNDEDEADYEDDGNDEDEADYEDDGNDEDAEDYEADELDAQPAVTVAVYEEYVEEARSAPAGATAATDEFEPEFSLEDGEDDEDAEDDEDDEDDDEDEDDSSDTRHQPRMTSAHGDKAALRNYLADIDDDEALDPLDDDDALEALDEPVLLDTAPRRSRLASLGLLLANLALVALLLWQYAAANIDRLSSSAPFAPLLPYACRVLDCPAPQRSQPELFVSEQLLVRSHPRYAEALEVNLVFRNDAPEAQPFPALELGLHDTGNRLLANRLFHPTEYLPVELHTSEMPAQSSLQVTLELLDPGSEAVNYTLGFRAP